jgi:lipoyl synthase
MVNVNSAEEIWRLSNNELLTFLNSQQISPESRRVFFYAPSFTYYKTKYHCSSPNLFPTVSITGSSCSLNCKHCGGKVLETMHSALTPEQLFETCLKFKQNGALGCLISGGCLPDGSVPLKNFADSIMRIKKELGLSVFVHTGIIDKETAVLMKNAGVDLALIDVIGSKETLQKVYNLKIEVEDYADALQALKYAGLNFVPHVIVGLNAGKIDGEFAALRMIKSSCPSAIVIIAFMPLRGTVMEKTQPPTPIDIARVVAAARFMFPQTPLALGCMRPKGKLRSETDILALKAGVDAVAFPSEEAIRFAQERNITFSFSSYCCSQMYLDMQRKTC